MDNSLQCDKCKAMAAVVRHVTDPGELAAMGRSLDLDAPAKPYYVIDCPNCGKRVVEESAR